MDLESLPEVDRPAFVLEGILSDLQDLAKRQEGITPEEQEVLRKTESAAEAWHKGELTDDQLAKALELVRQKRTIEGVDFSSIQINQIVNHGQQPLEIETFSPYLCDYDMKTGKIWGDNLLPADRIGLSVGTVLRQLFPEARIVSLYDEYNSSISGDSDARGLPTRDGAQYAFEPTIQQAFKDSVAEQLRVAQVITDESIEGDDYILISESSKVEQAPLLVERLEARGFIERKGQQIMFVNQAAENPLHREIMLRTGSGRWLCEALDAASYLDPENTDIVHVVVLPTSMREQQDKVWELLRILGVPKLNYHNIFYDEGVEPHKVSAVIKQEFKRFMAT